MRRRLLLVVATLLAAGCAAGAALATPAEDARVVADRFFAALLAADGKTVCSLFTARAVTILGGPEKCAQSLTADAASPSGGDTTTVGDGENADDYVARVILDTVFGDARALGVARGGYVTKQATVARLARDLRALEPELGFSVGSGARAARGTSSRHVVVDSHTSARVLTLYVESDSGTIWRLSAHGFARASIAKGGKGVAAQPTPPPAPSPQPQPDDEPTFAVAGVTFLDDTSAYATVVITYEGKSLSYVLSMRFEDGSWRVDDLLVPLFALLDGIGGS